MSVIYFFLAAVVGAYLMFCQRRSYHLHQMHVHLMMLGWMSMMIYGVGYHIIPRFNGNPLAFPLLATIHFWWANIALVCFVSMWGHGGYNKIPEKALAVLNVVGILLFVINILFSLRKQKEA